MRVGSTFEPVIMMKLFCTPDFIRFIANAANGVIKGHLVIALVVVLVGGRFDASRAGKCDNDRLCDI